MPRRSSPTYSGHRPGSSELPYNLLDKLFFHARYLMGAVEELDEGAVPATDEFSWVQADSLANYTRGWMQLRDAGLVEMREKVDRYDMEFWEVQLTERGLAEAEERNISPKVRQARADAVEAQMLETTAHAYANQPLFGML